MTREVATCKQNDTVYELTERMASGRFRHVPVIDHGRLAGIVSIGDDGILCALKASGKRAMEVGNGIYIS